VPLGRAVLSPSSPLLASDRGGLTGPNPIIKIGQEPDDCASGGASLRVAINNAVLGYDDGARRGI